VASRGVVAAGHSLTAETGATVLREGGNAVDAAVAAVMASFSLESALTGFGAGGFMLVGSPGEEPVLLDFFVAAPGHGGLERREELVPVPVHFDANTTQVFNAGAASCGVPGLPAGLAVALERFGSVELGDLIGPAVRFAREGAPLNRQQAYVLHILEPIYTATPEARAIYAPEGRILGEGELFRFPELADALERYAAEGADAFYEGEIAAAIEEYVYGLGGVLSAADLAAYRTIPREPVTAAFRGHEIFTNPPPSAGGILIALCLTLLERGGAGDTIGIARVMEIANRARQGGFAEELAREGFALDFLSAKSIDRLGSTTHLAAMDDNGLCASVTCSNGTGSGLVVPGTGIHLNNMLGEEDLNPLGFHRAAPGSRISSMMSPTIIRREGEVVAGLGSAGSNRIRSAVLQTTINLLRRNMDPQEAVDAARIHLEAGILQAEPGVDETALEELEREGQEVFRWSEKNLFFGGVQVVTRDPAAEGPVGVGRWLMPEMPDFVAEGLTDGLDEEQVAARLRLLEQLWKDGVDVDTMRREIEEGRLALLPADLILGRNQKRFSAREIAETTDIDVEDFCRLIVALGFPKPDPDHQNFGIEDVHAARRFKYFQDAGVPTDNLIAVSRQVGSSAARISQAHRDLLAHDLVDPGANEYEAAMSLKNAAGDLLPLGEQSVTYALRSHFIEQIRGDVVAAAEPGWLGPGKAIEVSVCFADLVGFTRLGERSNLERLGTVAKLLESVAIDVTNPDVRLVKLIGDAAMLVSENGEALLDAALRFIEVGQDAGEELPALRVGVARGWAVPQVGDWFGHPVNLASRITEAARPDSVLAEAAAVEAGGDTFGYSRAGEHKFKGLNSPVKLFRVRRKR
jgi:gamma-glutamyltranspeptidase/glutathione hydrolase